ncbi:hypothetical protein F4801DRAFT_456502 [Xylaria longipes]|nr:hypothetical protein F4801DRAFT_456502 [Xylaria longipes]
MIHFPVFISFVSPSLHVFAFPPPAVPIGARLCYSEPGSSLASCIDANIGHVLYVLCMLPPLKKRLVELRREWWLNWDSTYPSFTVYPSRSLFAPTANCIYNTCWYLWCLPWWTAGRDAC